MRDYDDLPVELRAWIAEAKLPWGPKSVYRRFSRALTQTGDIREALAELDRLQQKLIAKDATHIWGHHYPDAGEERAG